MYSAPQLWQVELLLSVEHCNLPGCVVLADPSCKGENWAALMADTSVDIGSVHVYPEFMPVCAE